MEHKSNMCLILCGEIYMLNLDDALLFEADDHYTEIHNLYGNKIMVPFCLGEIEREIRTRFPDHNNLVRMGRKYIINKNRVFYSSRRCRSTAPMGRWSYSMYRNQRSKA